jgi:hypothetical protein
MNNPDTIIGVDCATDPSNVGMALADACGEKPVIRRIATGADTSPVDLVTRWIKDLPRALLALDAPLGWPARLGRSLSAHRAGESIVPEPDNLFRRTTDRAVHDTLGRRPLEVGADRIARTAVAALRFLQELRQSVGKPIPLAWEPTKCVTPSAIEVYPAGTLLACGLVAARYKKRQQLEVRRRLIGELRQFVAFPDDISVLESHADALDATICCLAGWDFLQGRARGPTDEQLAEKEGWIWVRPSQTP